MSNSFGETVPIPSTVEYDDSLHEQRRWRRYHAETKPADTGSVALVMAETAASILESHPREEVRFARDEDANLIWAREELVRGRWGTPIVRREAQRAREADAAARRAKEHAEEEGVALGWHYRLSGTVPDNWLPLVADLQHHLVLRGRTLEGRLLTENRSFALSAAELPRIGRTVTLRARRARGADATTTVWSTWRVDAGLGETHSGLRNDYLTTEPPPA